MNCVYVGVCLTLVQGFVIVLLEDLSEDEGYTVVCAVWSSEDSLQDLHCCLQITTEEVEW